MTKVGAIIQTLTLATILLIIGLVCTLIGMAGLIWRIGYDRRRVEKTEIAAWCHRVSAPPGMIPYRSPNQQREGAIVSAGYGNLC